MTRRADDQSLFRIQPDPPVAGQPAEVTYTGDVGEIVVYVDGKSHKSYYPDAKGKFVIDPVPSGRELFLSDGKGYPGFLHKDIQELSR